VLSRFVQAGPPMFGRMVGHKGSLPGVLWTLEWFLKVDGLLWRPSHGATERRVIRSHCTFGASPVSIADVGRPP
jgi:hypothetical protein